MSILISLKVSIWPRGNTGFAYQKYLMSAVSNKPYSNSVRAYFIKNVISSSGKLQDKHLLNTLKETNYIY